MRKLFDKISRQSMPRVTATLIVCGDCAGDELLPIRTNLTTEDSCAECGGRSYEFASLIGTALASYLRNNTEIKPNVTKNYTKRETASEARDPKAKLRIVGRRAG